MFAWVSHPEAGNSTLSTGARARGLDISKLAITSRLRVSCDAGFRYQAERWERTYKTSPTMRDSSTLPSISSALRTTGEDGSLTSIERTLDPCHGEVAPPSATTR